eukprot:scaffold1687_cov405-Prasinococcus_capsulatus_cf.AAC.33
MLAKPSTATTCAHSTRSTLRSVLPRVPFTSRPPVTMHLLSGEAANIYGLALEGVVLTTRRLWRAQFGSSGRMDLTDGSCSSVAY